MDQLDQVGRAQGLIERSPVAFLAALLAVSCIALAILLVRALLRVEKLQRSHAKEIAAIQGAHAERVDEMRRDELERAVRLEHLVQGVLKMVEVGAIDVRRGRGRRKPTTNPGLVLEPEVPTQVFEPGDVEDD